MDEPTDARDVLRDVIAQWADGSPPDEVELHNINGAWTVELVEFLEFMAPDEPSLHTTTDDVMPSEYRETVESIAGRPDGTYGDAAAALLASLGAERADG